MKDYIGAIDQGTAISRFIIFNRGGEIVSRAHRKSISRIYPKPGWLEHDPEEIWQRTQNVIARHGGSATKTQ